MERLPFLVKLDETERKECKMRPIMMIVGTLILAGNLAMAIPVRPTVTSVKSVEQASRELLRKMVNVLKDRGLDDEAALQIIEASYGGKMHGFQSFHRVFALFPEIRSDAVIAYAAQRALHGSPLRLNEYDDVIGMLNSLHSLYLPQTLRSRAVQCVMLNRQYAKGPTPSATPA